MMYFCVSQYLKKAHELFYKNVYFFSAGHLKINYQPLPSTKAQTFCNISEMNNVNEYKSKTFVHTLRI